MLIGFSGAGGTGKTTTAKALAEAMGLPFVASSSRAVFEKHGIVEADQHKMTPDQQFELQMEIFTARQELEVRTFRGVSDRTLMDQVTYTMLRAPTVVTEDILNRLLDTTRNTMRKYTTVLYFPLITFPTNEDGMRETTYGLRVNFDGILQWVMREVGVPIIRVPVMSLAERVKWIEGNVR